MEDAVVSSEVKLILGEVDTLDVERARVLLLQPRVVVVGEAIEADDLVTLLEQILGEVRADEAGRPGHGIAH